jgi:hypothetical protein
MILFEAWIRDVFFPFHRVQARSAAHLATWSTDIGGYFSKDKAAGPLQLATNLNPVPEISMCRAIPTVLIS